MKYTRKKSKNKKNSLWFKKNGHFPNMNEGWEWKKRRAKEHTIIRMTKQEKRENERMDEFMDYKWLVLNVSAVFPLRTPIEEPAKSIGSFLLTQWTP